MRFLRLDLVLLGGELALICALWVLSQSIDTLLNSIFPGQPIPYLSGFLFRSGVTPYIFLGSLLVVLYVIDARVGAERSGKLFALSSIGVMFIVLAVYLLAVSFILTLRGPLYPHS